MASCAVSACSCWYWDWETTALSRFQAQQIEYFTNNIVLYFLFEVFRRFHCRVSIRLVYCWKVLLCCCVGSQHSQVQVF